MRRALGLGGHATPSAERPHSVPQPADHFHRRGKFVRDGEVQVEIVHRSQHQPNGEGNQLDAARQSIRNRLIVGHVEMVGGILDLYTNKLGHVILIAVAVEGSLPRTRFGQ